MVLLTRVNRPLNYQGCSQTFIRNWACCIRHEPVKRSAGMPLPPLQKWILKALKCYIFLAFFMRFFSRKNWHCTVRKLRTQVDLSKKMLKNWSLVDVFSSILSGTLTPWWDFSTLKWSSENSMFLLLTTYLYLLQGCDHLLSWWRM